MHRTPTLIAACCAVLLLSLSARGQEPEKKTETRPGQPAGLSDDQRLHHFLNRFTLGATPALLAEVRALGMRKWLDDQCRGDRPEPESLVKALAELKSIEMAPGELADAYLAEPDREATPEQRREIRQRMNIPPRELLDSVMLRATQSRNQLRETGADFLRNHFAVSLDKGPVAVLALDWERRVIRPGALGSFAETLDRSAHHPAMLFYLDNHLSCRPATQAEIEAIEKRGRNVERRLEELRQRGLNENYARELLELHTLGVDNYYTQDDVIQVAKCLTGWTITPARARGLVKGEPGTFLFVPDFHCPGDKTVLGTAIRENKEDPQAEGRQVIQLLAGHEGTARFLAFKLCRWFVHDEPDAKMVERVARVFRQTRGSLPAVYLAIYEDPEFFRPANYLAKYKRPFEFVVSALRATGAVIRNPGALHRQLAEMNEPVYRCADPTGYYDQAEAWQDPGAMSLRWKFAHDLARGGVPAVQLPPDFYDDLPLDKPETWKELLARRLLCMPLGTSTSRALDQLVARETAGTRPRQLRQELGPLLVAGILGSPEFQKQ